MAGPDIDSLLRLEAVAVRLEALLDQHADHESRLRSLERNRWVVAGVVGLGMFLISVLK